MKSIKSWALLLVAIAIIGGYWALIRQIKQQSQNTTEPIPIPIPSSAAGVSSPSQLDQVTTAAAAPLKTPSVQTVDRRALAEKLSSHFDLQHDPYGDIAYVRKKPGAPLVKPDDLFRILKSVLVGHGKNNLEPLKTSRSPASVQTTYEQRINGIKLYPPRGITMTTDREGNAIKAEINLLPEVRVNNKKTLTAQEAQEISTEHLNKNPDQSVAPTASMIMSAPSDTGTLVVWTISSTRPPPGSSAPIEAKIAYVFNSRGTETVIDAQSGALLSKKNGRLE